MTAGARLAHAPEWRTAIARAYGHEPLYIAGEDRRGRPGLLPAFVVRRPLAGTVVTSMPFLDSGGPSASSPALAAALVARLTTEARRRGAAFVDMRCTEPLSIDATPNDSKVNLVLELPADPAHLWKRLDGSVRSQIRKAERAGLAVESGGAELLPEFYGPFASRMRDLGSPVHSYAFLRTVLECFGARACVAIVRKERAAIGGLIALASGDRLVVPWAACLREHFVLCPNMLLYWETLRRACADGYGRFEFGRSTRGSGTYRFKLQWGALEEPLYWYTIRLRGAARPSPEAAGLVARAWQRMPLALATTIGPTVRRFLIQ